MGGQLTDQIRVFLYTLKYHHYFLSGTLKFKENKFDELLCCPIPEATCCKHNKCCPDSTVCCPPPPAVPTYCCPADYPVCGCKANECFSTIECSINNTVQGVSATKLRVPPDDLC